ncbi:MAG: ATP-dependent zinc protease [Gammaproteobacteria bacterium]
MPDLNRLRPALLLLVLALCSATPAGAQPPRIAGWVEYAWIEPGHHRVRAKLDTGARNSSLDAPSLHIFKRGGEDWARFRLDDGSGRGVSIERPVVRFATIKRHFGRTERRPVIRLSLCMDGRLRDAEVNLVDRTGLIYPLLIGRSFLKNHYAVDPASTYLFGRQDCRAHR